MEHQLIEIIKLAGYLLEAFGVLVVIIGSCIATWNFLRTHKHLSENQAYRRYRQNLGRSIILGLEFLIAGDIIRTIVVPESLENVAILALIVLIRTFLGITLHLEVEGRWPWEKETPPADRDS